MINYSKNSITVLLLYVTSYMTLFAQFDNNLINTPVPQSNPDLYFSFLLDSSVRYEYYSVNDSSPVTKNIYRYDGKGQKYSQHKLIYGDHDSWENSVRYIWLYDEAGNITSKTKSIWYPYDKKWVYDSMEIWKYNDRNKLALSEKYVWSSSLFRWIGSGNKKEYWYDDKDSLGLLIASIWDEEGNKWIGNYMDMYDYDDQGNNILNRNYDFSEAIGWYILEEIIRTYDQTGHMIVE